VVGRKCGWFAICAEARGTHNDYDDRVREVNVAMSTRLDRALRSIILFVRLLQINVTALRPISILE
jgi:hypothetical protein